MNALDCYNCGKPMTVTADGVMCSCGWEFRHSPTGLASSNSCVLFPHRKYFNQATIVEWVRYHLFLGKVYFLLGAVDQQWFDVHERLILEEAANLQRMLEDDRSWLSKLIAGVKSLFKRVCRGR